MKTNNKKLYSIFVIVLIVSILATFFLTNQFHISKFKIYQSEIQVQIDKESDEIQTLQNQIKAIKEENSDFIKEYAITLNNIHVAMTYLGLADTNLGSGNSYTISGEYYYDLAIPFYDGGKDQVLKAKQWLDKANIKLKSIENKTPSSFYKEDVINRIGQVDSLLLVDYSLYSLLDYQGQQIYEVNYGSESKATEYFNKYNNLIPDYNSGLKQASVVSDKIDLQWDHDWYESFQG